MKICKYLLCVAVALVALLMPFFVFLSVLGDLSEETVLQTLPSPDGAYVAEVICSDQGAMGGNTLVVVTPAGKKGKQQRVYTGSWEEQYSLNIYWKTDTCLMINGSEYDVE